MNLYPVLTKVIVLGLTEGIIDDERSDSVVWR